MHRTTYQRLLLVLLIGPSKLIAQAAPAADTASVPCEGSIVTRIVVRPAPPPFAGRAAKWQAAARAVGLHHATTSARVVEAFMALHVGRECTEFRRAESERVLRAQPFIADASVKLEPDGHGGVVAVVATTDEIPVLVDARFRGVVPDALSLGNANVAGQGLRVEAGWESARAYRTGFGARVAEYAAFDRPYVARLEGFQHRVGYEVEGEIGHPLFTNLQRISWHIGARSSEDYPRFARPADDELALRVADRRWDAGGSVRLFGTGTVTLLGGAMTGRNVDPASEGVVLSRSGIEPDTGVALKSRYTPFKATRIGVIGGIRNVRFVQVSGFDALTGSQDVASGVEAGLFVAHGLPSWGESDLFLSGATYAGVVTPHVMLANLAALEGRRDIGGQEWNSIVGSTRTALYLRPTSGATFILSDELSGGVRSRLPLQLTLNDRVGGILGYHNSPLAGAQRNVVRAESRWSLASRVHSADVGFGAFSEIGSLWAGDTPYGWTGTRASIGVSLLAAYPTRSKRLYRADLAIPLTRGGEGGGRIELRFSSEDRTVRFWEEPDDVARARTGSLPSTLFAWPTR